MNADTPDPAERRHAATEQAAAWLAAFRSGRLSARERGEFVDWLRDSPLHIAEMLRVGQIDRALEAFNRWGEIPAAEQPADNVVRLMDGKSPPPRRVPVRAATRAIAAGLAVVVVAASGWLVLRPTGTTVRTQLLEQRQMTLADGSILNIAPRSELHIRFSDDQRSLTLRRGHVLFDVAPDRRRPFVVDAGTAVVTAVGTSFDLDRAEDVVRVTVIEGHVAVSRANVSSGSGGLARTPEVPHRVLLAANEAVVVQPEVPIGSVHAVNGAAQAAWVTGTLVFEDETVAEVARRLNLHNAAQIRVLDAQLAGRRISGAFKASDPESFVAFIRETSADPAHDRSTILLEPRSQ